MLLCSSDFHVKILTFLRSYQRLCRLEFVLAEKEIREQGSHAQRENIKLEEVVRSD